MPAREAARRGRVGGLGRGARLRAHHGDGVHPHPGPEARGRTALPGHRGRDLGGGPAVAARGGHRDPGPREPAALHPRRRAGGPPPSRNRRRGPGTHPRLRRLCPPRGPFARRRRAHRRRRLRRGEPRDLALSPQARVPPGGEPQPRLRHHPPPARLQPGDHHRDRPGRGGRGPAALVHEPRTGGGRPGRSRSRRAPPVRGCGPSRERGGGGGRSEGRRGRRAPPAARDRELLLRRDPVAHLRRCDQHGAGAGGRAHPGAVRSGVPGARHLWLRDPAVPLRTHHRRRQACRSRHQGTGPRADPGGSPAGHGTGLPGPPPLRRNPGAAAAGTRARGPRSAHRARPRAARGQRGERPRAR